MLDLLERAPAQGRRVRQRAGEIASYGLPDIGVPDPDGRVRRRWIPVPPHGFFYRVDGLVMTVLEVVDARQRREPWPNPGPSRGQRG